MPESHSAVTEKRKYAALRGEICRTSYPTARSAYCSARRPDIAVAPQCDAGFSAGAKCHRVRNTIQANVHAAVLFHLIAPIITPRRFQSHFRLFTAAKTAVSKQKECSPGGRRIVTGRKRIISISKPCSHKRQGQARCYRARKFKR